MLCGASLLAVLAFVAPATFRLLFFLFVMKAASTRFILGRGCDPQRAKYAEQSWSKALGVNIHVVTSDDALLEKLDSGVNYEVFFIAPGMCQLIKSKAVTVDYQKLVRERFPNIRFVNIEDVGQAMSKLKAALNLEGDSCAFEGDWPFPD